MAFLGFHPNAFAAHAQLNTYFMFWIHTELVGRLGLLEYIINTPSAHRMHHRPPGNCNYAGALIIWDRMFDTYVYICIFFFLLNNRQHTHAHTHTGSDPKKYAWIFTVTEDNQTRLT